jgi:hypothetical protein
LSGVAATKSLFVRLQVADATINLRLGEGSTLEVGELTQTEAKADSFKVPGSRLELLSAVWVPKEAEELADGTADYLQRLKVGAVEVSAKSFQNFRSGKIKTFDVTLRVADQRISIRQSEGSMSSVILK